MPHSEFELTRDAYGRLVFCQANEAPHIGITPVRSFPISEPDKGISLMSAEGHELRWIEHLSDLPEAQAKLIEETLAVREFVPEILAIQAVSSFACPSTWSVHTNRGETRLVLNGEEDIRRLSREQLLIKDAHGIEYYVRNMRQLDKASRAFLDRFL